ncbi:EcsC family protein [Tumebacillus sp. BK434]|uniref:EcsC family protein n=1 Tax=Tumebacillus sp. BK434 TaxID=2512169 RepID=UPI0010502C73|nr:EcsC family protein [Tumebacillus sp. BK434]TCP58147.1 EcsC family protein [Tumebacillus sp. BK434]
MDNRETLLHELQLIEEWEQDQKDLWFWEKLGRLPFMLLDKVTPKFLQEKAGQAVDELVSYVETGGKYMADEQAVFKRIAAVTHHPVASLDEVRALPITLMKQSALDLRKSRQNFATAQGAVAGLGGVFTLAIDIPFLLGMSLKTIQDVGMCYGYDPLEKSERVFIIKCLQFTSSDIVGKKAILEELSSMHLPERNRQMFSQLQGWREVLLMQTENFGWKKLFQLVPVAGILFGAYLNRKTIDEVAETALMLYGKRRIMERLER